MAISLRSVRATRYVTPFREGGSLPGLVEADDDGLYVVKFRGAAQGPRALVAELLAGELGRAIGLPVPELVFVEIDPELATGEPDYWVRELLEKSPGCNVGLDFLPGSLTYSPAADPRPEPAFAADIVWFDSLVTNADRSSRNPNMLAWHGRLWLIDHGAAFFVHHAWSDPDGHARRPLATIHDHILLGRAGSIAAAHDRMAPLVTAGLVGELVRLIPDAWLAPDGPAGGPAGQRTAYERYIATRLDAQAGLSRDLDLARHAR
ncbi:MAG TPA: HipA family kinase [Candidatus Sulfomarinibacteraceae bacterium]|nr:HipA family kinase [Candidatus Sulfomarinibacteraceae bacterium]